MANQNLKIMLSAAVPGQYPTIGAILDPHKFSLDTTFNQYVWRVFDLTIPGWRITDENVRTLCDTLTDAIERVNRDTAPVILQLCDSKVCMVGRTRGENRSTIPSPLLTRVMLKITVRSSLC
jgi:hypothetical protein